MKYIYQPRVAFGGVDGDQGIWCGDFFTSKRKAKKGLGLMLKQLERDNKRKDPIWHVVVLKTNIKEIKVK